MYRIEYRTNPHPWATDWGKTTTIKVDGLQVRPAAVIAGRETAERAAYRCHHRWPSYDFRVVSIKTGRVVVEIQRYSGKITTPEEEEESATMDGKPDITEPIKLKREAVIARLNEIHDEEKAKREEAEAKEAALRQEVVDFLNANVDRVAEFFKSRFGPDWGRALEELVEHEFSGDNWEPVNKVPTRRESDSEKFVRVLEMSDDATVSLTPNQPLYEVL